MENPKDILVRQAEAAEAIRCRVQINLLVDLYDSPLNVTVSALRSSTSLTQVRS